MQLVQDEWQGSPAQVRRQPVPQGIPTATHLLPESEAIGAATTRYRFRLVTSPAYGLGSRAASARHRGALCQGGQPKTSSWLVEAWLWSITDSGSMVSIPRL